MVDMHLIVVRTLNYLRATHLPTYVALRLLLESVPKKKLGYVVEAIITQVTIRKTARLLDIKRFKGRSEGNYTYRPYSVPSPTGALADAYAIFVLQSSGVLKGRDYVYSYRLPVESNYTRSFEHFSFGYKQRNNAVHAALMTDGNLAVVADIRSFYPSVQAADSIRRLELHMAKASKISRRDHAVVLAASRRCFAAPDERGHVGLRVGPEMSHVLADIALEDVDNELCNLFLGRYFRYVDDIVIVTSATDLARVQSQLNEILSRAGFSRSEEKDAVVDRNEWSGYNAVGINVSKDDLAQLKFRIKLFLGRNPSQVNALREALVAEGVFLPVDLLLQGGFDRGWRDRVSSFLRVGWRVATAYWFDSIGDVITHAAMSRNNIIREADDAIVSTNFTAPPISRKWQVQRARFAINRALYFATPDMLARIRNFASMSPELAETESVCDALLGNISQLFLMPGNAVSAASQLLVLRGNADFPSAGTSEVGSDGTINADVIAYFAMRAAIVSSPPKMKLTDDAAGLLAFALAELPTNEEPIGGDGFGREVLAIGTNFSQVERRAAASTRFSSNEDVVLDALSLGSGYASL